VADDERPPVWIGHVVLRTPAVAETRAFMEQLGLRPIAGDDGFGVLELRGGTHLVVLHADEPSGGDAGFDLMVEDLDATHARLDAEGLAPTTIENGRIHRSFTVRSPSGHTLRFNSSHVSDRPV